VLRAVPPELREYQATVPIGLVGSEAVRVTVPAPHLEALVTAGADGLLLIVTVTGILAADIHPVVKFLCEAQ